MSNKLSKRERRRFVQVKRTRKKLFITLMSMLGALSLMAIGAFASTTSFSVAISNNIAVNVEFASGTLKASRFGGVYAEGENINQPATNVLNSIIYTTNPGENDDLYNQNLIDLQNTKLNVDVLNNNITYVFHFTRAEEAVGNTRISLVDESDIADGISITYKYSFVNDGDAPLYNNEFVNNSSIFVDDTNVEVYIECKLVADTDNTLSVYNLLWKFTLNFDGDGTFASPIITENNKNYIELGEFPQSYVGSTLNSTLETAYNNGTLTNGMTLSDGETYAIGGDEDPNTYTYYAYNYGRYTYVRVPVTRAYYSSLLYSDGSSIAQADSNTVSWFRVEPIRWRILSTYDGTETTDLVLISEKVLTASVMWGVEDYWWGNNPNICYWLNSVFLNQAFSNDEITNNIQTSLDDNNSVTLLSEYEIQTGESRYFQTLNDLSCKATDFALANNCFIDITDYNLGRGNCKWLLRDHHGDDAASYIGQSGSLYGSNLVSYEANKAFTYYGVRPSITINL